MRTNNCCEGANYALNSSFPTKPKFHKLLLELKRTFRLALREIKLSKKRKLMTVDPLEEVIMEEFFHEFSSCDSEDSEYKKEICYKYLKKFIENDSDKKKLNLFK